MGKHWCYNCDRAKVGFGERCPACKTKTKKKGNQRISKSKLLRDSIEEHEDRYTERDDDYDCMLYNNKDGNPFNANLG